MQYCFVSLYISLCFIFKIYSNLQFQLCSITFYCAYAFHMLQLHEKIAFKVLRKWHKNEICLSFIYSFTDSSKELVWSCALLIIDRHHQLLVPSKSSPAESRLLLGKQVEHLLHTRQLLLLLGLHSHSRSKLPTADVSKLLHAGSHVEDLSIFQRRTTTAGLLFSVCRGGRRLSAPVP